MSLRPDLPDIWFQITKNEQTIESEQAFVESDIPSADIISLRGRVRIVNHTANTHGPVSIGYKLDMELSKIDPQDIPDKYGTDRPILDGKLIEPAIIVPTYSVQFIFRLLDKDGFLIAKITGPKHSVTSGKVNSIQGQTESLIQRSQANLIERISVDTFFVTTHGVRPD